MFNIEVKGKRQWRMKKEYKISNNEWPMLNDEVKKISCLVCHFAFVVLRLPGECPMYK
jgi:hypothetical protein